MLMLWTAHHAKASQGNLPSFNVSSEVPAEVISQPKIQISGDKGV